MRLNLLCRRLNLKKSVKAPTRGENILDQILTNMLAPYNDVQHLPPIGRSNHQCLLFTPKFKEKFKPISREVRQIKRSGLNELGLHWETVFCAEEVDGKVNAFTKLIVNMLDELLPKRTVRIHPCDKPWMTSSIKLKTKAIQKAYTSGDKEMYKLLCEKLTSLISKAKENYYQRKTEAMRETNTAKWYKTTYQLPAANDCNFQMPADVTTDLAHRMQQSCTKPWRNVTPTKIPDVGEIENLLKNISH